ncbi:MAG TPA: hypothetical protein P5123_00030 [Spirochaetota bacterium]|nr:hypothetical protein [Spirochaetota bacterium]
MKYYKVIMNKIKDYRILIRRDLRERNRFFLLMVSLMLILNYFLYCFHVEKNIFDIYPSFPVMEKREDITIYLPGVKGEILEETRLVELENSKEKTIEFIVAEIVRGSKYENTRMVVPIEFNIRKVWIHGSECYIDIRLETLNPETPILPESEGNFKKAVEKSITANYNEIKSVAFLENGISNRNLWEKTIINE